MAILFAVIYPDEETATKALETLEGLQEAGFLNVRESLYVVKDDDGDVKVKDAPRGKLGNIAGGALLGGIAGALFAAPVIGVAIGGVIGGFFGPDGGNVKEDIDALTEIVSNSMQPGNSAIVVFADSTSPDRVAAELGKWGGTFVSTDLTEEQVNSVQRMINRSSHTS